MFYAEHSLIKDADYDRIIMNLNNFAEEYLRKDILDVYADPKKYPEEWDLKGLCDAACKQYNLREIVVEDEIKDMAKDELDEFVITRFKNVMLLKENILGKERLCYILKNALFFYMDKMWV